MKLKGIICLYGDLGAGKTTFIKGFAELLQIPEISIKSPTYTYIREYETPSRQVFHFDLYRLEGKIQTAKNMVSEALERNPDLVVIEWAEYLGKYLPEERIDIRVSVRGETEREIHIKHHTKKPQTKKTRDDR